MQLQPLQFHTSPSPVPPRSWTAALCLILTLALLAPAFLAQPAAAKKAKDDGSAEDSGSSLDAATFAGLEWRGIGPAFTSGRIIDLAVDPRDDRQWYVAVASGGVWKTDNGGTTWQPLFDNQGSYSIGCITLDPNNPHVVWVGSGENNSQRSVGYGDGVYKSLDGGKTWKNVGLENSEHIAKIVIDPRDSDVVYVAAQGPLWSAGGDRGLYKSTDGGENWQQVLEISEHTGVTDLVYDPRDPDVLYAASYQRRRRVWSLINGGPEAAIYKSTDAGASWTKLETGLPQGDVGRIGLAISPLDPDVLYAIIEATGDEEGFYRSTDRGASWEKRSSYVSRSPQYYQEIFVDPHDDERIYSMDVWMQVSEDGGATWSPVPENHKHVDNHALWIDPEDPDHLLAGCDGGLYESFDRGATWRFFDNLPVTQFYKLEVDNDVPFYNVYGGTQDNFSFGGPTRTTTAHGIVNADWYITLGGDGFQTRVDPENPDIVYSQLQYANLVRFDRKTGEAIDIQPLPGPDEDPPRWNWDSPLIISPHDHERLYFASQRLYRSDDRGDSWRPVSGDLTRSLDRNELEMMGRTWSIDAVSKNVSTSPYGNVVSLSESPLVEGLIYAGTDDGLIQVTEDGGENWRQIASFPGIPELIYVNDLFASQHDADVVYAAFNNHKSGDFKPYVLKSTDRGQSWVSISGDLPERGSVYAVYEDHVESDLLFAGTEFGLFASLDGGVSWVELGGNLPTVAVRDVEIQKRENDLVLATFGRGFYVLDDYTPLRHVDAASLDAEPRLFPVKKAWSYNQDMPLGLPGKAFQGDDFYAAPNPPFGAVFTYYLPEKIETRQEKRRATEKELREKGEKISYPPWDEIRAEEREEEPAIVLTVRDADGHVIRRLHGPVAKGFHRVAWDLRFPPSTPARLAPPPSNPFSDPPVGPLVVPDTYTVELARRVDGVEEEIGEPQSFVVEPLVMATLPAKDRPGLLAFQRQVADLQRAVLGAAEVVDDTSHRLELIRVAIDDTPAALPQVADRLRQLEAELWAIRDALFGDEVKERHQAPTLPSILERVYNMVSGGFASLSDPTATQRQSYEVAAEAFSGVLEDLRHLVEVDLAEIEAELEAAGAPYTPGRLPRFERR